jgi:hypothetical protein
MLRRDFFKRASQSIGALWALQSTVGTSEIAAAPLLLPADGHIDPRDEKVWAEVAQPFSPHAQSHLSQYRWFRGIAANSHRYNAG